MEKAVQGVIRPLEVGWGGGWTRTGVSPADSLPLTVKDHLHAELAW